MTKRKILYDVLVGSSGAPNLVYSGYSKRKAEGLFALYALRSVISHGYSHPAVIIGGGKGRRSSHMTDAAIRRYAAARGVTVEDATRSGRSEKVHLSGERNDEN